MSAPSLVDAEIRRIADGGAYARGLDYARGGAVRRVSWDAASGLVVGLVAGSADALYRCTVRLDATATPPRIMTTACTCPLGGRCKHVVATLLRSNAGAGTAVQSHGQIDTHGQTHSTPPLARDAPPVALGGSVRAEPHWRSLVTPSDTPRTGSALALGVELRVRESRATAHWGARRVQTATPGSLAAALAQGRADDLTVGLRPLTRSASTRAWVRAGVSWESLRRAAPPHPAAQVRWFAELYGIVHDVRLLSGLRDDSAWVSLDTVDSALLWPHLRAAEAVGIPVVATSARQSVTVAAASHASLLLERAGDGDLRLSAHVVVEAPSTPPRSGDPTPDAGRSDVVRPIGHVGLYSVAAPAGGGIRVTLAPADVSAATRSLLGTAAGIRIPAAEVGAFLHEAYPLIARDGEVRAGAGVRLPAPAPTTVVATVAFGPASTVRHTLHWHRPGLPRMDFEGADDAGETDDETLLRTGVTRAWTDHGLTFVPSATLSDVDAAEFVSHVLPALERMDGVRVEVSGRRREFRELTGDPRITVKTVETTDSDWFDLGVLVEIDGHRIPFRPLFTAVALRKKKLLLSDGHYFTLAHPALDRLRELIDEAGALAEWESGPQISRYQLPLWEDFEDLADEALPAVSWRATVGALRAGDVTRVAPPVGLRAELRPYQQEGFQRLALWWRHRLGGILADDMGLGKTLQVLALLLHARESGERRPFLVVAPTSVLATWRAEAERFAPGLRVRMAESARAAREAVEDATGSDVVVTSYTLLRLEEEAFAGARWAGVVLDEAQFVKNPRTRLHRAVQALQADTVLAVTGTPLENSLGELWALLSLTCPGLFPSARRFREEYIKPIEQGKVPENEEGGPYRERRLARLRARVRPFLLRRTKDAVAPELPARQEQELHVELSPAHRAIYDAVLQRERQKVLGLLADLDRNRFIVFRSLTLLRRLALDPSLVDAAPSGDGGAGIRSSKLEALGEHLDELIAEGHRALVFSQFTSYLGLVRAELDARGIRYAYLDGSTRRRSDVVDAFRGGDAPVFLISLKAGGFGLTLTEADYVFLLDPWWNPAAEAQAIDRTHRIGQERPVNVYRLIASGTIEEKVLALQQRKARLFHAVMGDDDLLARSLTADDIRGLLDP